MESILEFLIIFLLIIFQSLFGIGLLLFGTPAFLFLGYDFEATLILLLPISICISFLQVNFRKFSINSLAREFNLYCLPFLVLFLILTINFGEILDIKIYASMLLIISSLIILIKDKINNIKKYLPKYRKFFLIIIGVIHGLTNMGGGFLSIFSASINNNRLSTRNYISYGYLIMGIFQYVTILLIGLNSIDFTKLFYIPMTLILFYPLQILFNDLNDKFFIEVINYTALTFGITALSLSLI